MKKINLNSAIIGGLFLLLPITLPAQKPKMGTWKSYLAYQDAKLIEETPNHVFAVYNELNNGGRNNGALMSYSPEDGEIRTYSIENGLNDLQIIRMAYSSEIKTLILIYGNSNIDLFYGENNVINISSIKNNDKYEDKTINNITLNGKYAYLSTAFGIVVLNLERKEIENTYLQGVNTKTVCLWGDYFYAVTDEGIKKGLKSSFLFNKDNWESYRLNYTGNPSGIDKMLVFKDHLVFYDTSNTNTYYLAKDGTVKLLLDAPCRQLTILHEQLVLCTSNAVFFYTDFDKWTKIDRSVNTISSYKSNTIYWITQGEKGIAGIKKEVNANESTLIEPEIQLNSPMRNLCFYLTHSAGKLLVVGGNLSGQTNGTFMIYENGRWFNFDDRIIAAKSGLKYNNTPWCQNFTSVAVDPRDPKHYFVGSFQEGVYEFQDTLFVKLYSRKNTGNALQSALAASADAELYVRTPALAFDRNNNLYVANARVPNGLVIMTNNNEWKSFYYSDFSNQWMSQILITRNNQKWINAYRGSIGLFVLDDNGTVDDFSDDIYYCNDRFVDQRGTDIKATTYACLAEDMNGSVWVGTDNGPISFSSATQVGEGVCNRIILSDQYENGYYPLEGVSITTIAVDGGNRKWMGSQGNGVFVVDNSGENVTVENFHTGNSPLISDNITSIAIDNKTGEVFIGTDKGLVSYMNEATEGSSDYSNVYAYPNPIKPAHDSQVVITGLVSNSTVKITDLAGNLIQQGSSIGGQYVWNCTNRAGSIVKAGIYLIFGSLPDGTQGVVTKVMVIK
jgi:hypothetical protein